AEDGIRDKLVTGVQTCALPILRTPQLLRSSREVARESCVVVRSTIAARSSAQTPAGQRKPRRRESERANRAGSSAPRSRPGRLRSEERRVGKEWRARGGGGW